MPKRQLIAAGFSQTMAKLLERLITTPYLAPDEYWAGEAAGSMAG
jgi:hypothetical protein